MSQSILHKYSSQAGVVPSAAELLLRELALNTADGRIFLKKSDGSVLTFKDASAFATAVHTHAISDIVGLQTELNDLSDAVAAAQSAATGASLQKSANLSDLSSVSTARTNLDVFSKSEVTSAIGTAKTEAQSYTDGKISALINGAPEILDTLKEIADAIAAGDSVATALSSSISAVSGRVSTLEGQNLDSRITTAQAGADASLKKASNLSDLTDASAARSNLGLGSMAVQNSTSVSISGGSVTGSVTFGSNSATLPTDAGMILTDQSTIDGGTFAGV